MSTIISTIKLRYYLRLANKYSQKSNKAGWGLERNHYFQKYCHYQNKVRIMEEELDKAV